MFIYKYWSTFCKDLNDCGINSVTAVSLRENESGEPYLILKHDVETNPSKALRLAKIENKYYHKGTYYIQAYLLKSKRNIEILKQIQHLGHEVSYHHDVLDSCHGNFEDAKIEFESNVKLFEENGFNVITVCQHGNPVVERDGYTSNRDFFRRPSIADSFSNISDIMVNFSQHIHSDFGYISDSGYGWKQICDPENNDRNNSSDDDIDLGDLNGVLNYIESNQNTIVSTHPHRWQSNVVAAKLHDVIFRVIKIVARALVQISFFKRIMNRFYYLAKKI